MARRRNGRELVKPSHRGDSRENPEPSGPRGTRSVQRSTLDQVNAGYPAPGGPTRWELTQQESLPRRGEGSQHYQGSGKDPKLRERRQTDDAPRGDLEQPDTNEGLQSGGARGSSNQASSGLGR
jgi:hypothetical protein